MTEEGWLSCTDPAVMLKFLQPAICDRKARLFASACVRLVWHLVTDWTSQNAVEVAEQFADGKAQLHELRQAGEQATEVANRLEGEITALINAAPDAPEEPPPQRRHLGPLKMIGNDNEYLLMEAKAAAAMAAANCADFPIAAWQSDNMAAWATAFEALNPLGVSQPVFFEGVMLEQHNDIWKQRRKHHAALLRDVVGNPFHAALLDPAWHTSNVVQFAQQIYDERQFDLMPILGDALIDAGCTKEQIIQHCHQKEGHVRGCWLIDLLLGKG